MKLSTNIPDALYQQIEILANKQSIPVEQLVTMALAAQISSWMTKDYLEEKAQQGSWDKFCVISLACIGSINLCVLRVFVVRYTPSPGGMYLRIHFTHQIQESLVRPRKMTRRVTLSHTFGSMAG